MAGNVPLRSVSATMLMSLPSWLMMLSRWAVLVATVMSFVWRFSRICRTSRCSIDSVPPVGDASRGRNCLLRPSLLSGHSLLPDPPDSNMSCICCFYLLCGKSSNFCQAAKRYFCKTLVVPTKKHGLAQACMPCQSVLYYAAGPDFLVGGWGCLPFFLHGAFTFWACAPGW